MDTTTRTNTVEATAKCDTQRIGEREETIKVCMQLFEDEYP